MKIGASDSDYRKTYTDTLLKERRMNIVNRSMLAIVLALTLNPGAHAEDFEVGQKNKHFTVKQLEIKVGDVVKFTNEDPFFHNVFSLSENKSFDLGSYEKGKSREVKFDKPGVVDVECAIHPRMHMQILVKD